MNRKTLALYGAAGLLAIGVIAGPAATATIGSAGQTTTSTVPGGSITDAAAAIDESVIPDAPVVPAVASTPEADEPEEVLPAEEPVESTPEDTADDPVVSDEDDADDDKDAADHQHDADCADKDDDGRDGSWQDRDSSWSGDRDDEDRGDDRPSQVKPAAPRDPQTAAESPSRGDDAGAHRSGDGEGDGRRR